MKGRAVIVAHAERQERREVVWIVTCVSVLTLVTAALVSSYLWVTAPWWFVISDALAMSVWSWLLCRHVTNYQFHRYVQHMFGGDDA